MARFGNLDNTIQESEKQVSDLEKRKVELEPAVEVLEKTKTSLERSVTGYEQTFKKVMQSMIDTASDAVTKTSKAGEEASRKIVAIGEKADEVTKQYARTHGVLVFEALIRTVNGESVPINEVRNAAVHAMTILQSRLPPRATYRHTLESVIKDLKDDTSLGLYS